MGATGPALVLALCAAGAAGGGGALDVRVRGDVLFHMQLSEAAARRLERASPAPRAPAPAPAHAPACPRLPQRAQLDAILSNMMNELTKVFVRANIFLKSERNARHPGVWKAEQEGESTSPLPLPPPAARVAADPTAPPAAAPPPAAAHVHRFQIVNSKNTQFFELIFQNMTEEFSALSPPGAGAARAHGPCPPPRAARRAWRRLLRRSQAAFRRAALRCVQDYLRRQECEERTKARLVRFLVRELSKMRARHLRLLCDDFQLCLGGEPPAGPRASALGAQGNRSLLPAEPRASALGAPGNRSLLPAEPRASALGAQGNRSLLP